MPIVLVTGANRGIGLEFARQYSADRWHVIATARDAAGADELNSLGVQIEQVDMLDLDAVVALGSGIATLDVLIANAGTWIPEQAESAGDGRAWTEMMVTNCIAPYLLAKSVLRQVAQSKGKLVALTSGMGSISESSGGYVPYRTSKAALNMAWHSLAIEARPLGVVAAVIDPGWVKTRVGGPSAPTSAARSVGDMRERIERLGARDSGAFLKRDGTRHAW
jgi:NAD(P)-dependent dehydrogenase (short-subunit alcohol dehydrogenase family)